LLDLPAMLPRKCGVAGGRSPNFLKTIPEPRDFSI